MVTAIIRTVEGREGFLAYLLARLPGAVATRDATRNALDTFVAACRAADIGPALHLEDDVILTSGFAAKVGEVLQQHPGEVVQFFSMRKADLTIGSRREPGRTFLMGQCFYLPAGMSAALAEYAARWPRRAEHPTGLDTMVSDYLRENRLAYWLHVPSLVQHRDCVSMISHRRSKTRQSLTFVNPDE